MRFSFLAFLIFVGSYRSASQDTVRVMTYNLLRYYPADHTRDQYYRTVIRAANPDVVVVQEIDSASAVLNFLTNVLNVGGDTTFAAGTFIDGFDSDNALFYNKGKIQFVENIPIKTGLRDINHFIIRDRSSDRTISIFSVHLKAGRDPASQDFEADSVRRAREVDSLRNVTNALPSGTDFIVLGDFNIYHSFEPAYQKLISVDAGNEGHLVDPLAMQGIWNDAAFAQFHTQSPRTRAFGFGATGGLDDRFDMILFSKAVAEPGGIAFVPDSYRAFGNDGEHYNDSINRRPNSAVADSVADALHAASDHLPVLAEFVFDPAVGVERGSLPLGDFLAPNYPNPFNPVTVFSYQLSGFSAVRLSIFDLLGRELAVLVDDYKQAGNYTVAWDASDAPTGVYFCRMTAGRYVEIRRLVLMK